MRKYILLSFIVSFSTITNAQTVTSFNSDNLHFLADIYNESWALIIGINDYEHMPNLNYAVNDAVSIKEMLMSNYNYKEDNKVYKGIIFKEKEQISQGEGNTKKKSEQDAAKNALIFYNIINI